MADVVTESLSDYIRTENAKEREAAGLDGDGPGLPEAEPLTASEIAQTPTEGDSPEPEPEQTVETTAQTERNADGTFKGKRDKVQERIDKATAKQRDAERRAEAAEARARELEARTTSSTPPEAVATPTPTSDDEPNFDQWVAANPTHPDPIGGFAKYAAKWAAKQALAERDAAEQAVKAQQQARERLTQSDAEGREQFADWDEAISSEFAQTFEFPPYLIAGIQESAQSAALRYYLSTHETEARALAAKSPASALVELGTLAARLTPAHDGSGTRTVVHSKAKPLTKPLRGSTPSAPSAAALDPEKATLSDWIRFNNAADRRREREMRGA